MKKFLGIMHFPILGLLAVTWVVSLIISLGWILSLPVPAILSIFFCVGGVLYFAISHSRSYELERAPDFQLLDIYFHAFHNDFIRYATSLDLIDSHLVDIRFLRDRLLENPLIIQPSSQKAYKEALEECEEIIEFMSDEIASFVDYGFPIYGLMRGSPKYVKEHCLAFDKYLEEHLYEHILKLSELLKDSIMLISTINSRLITQD